jgi:hypothetical protein
MCDFARGCVVRVVACGGGVLWMLCDIWRWSVLFAECARACGSADDASQRDAAAEEGCENGSMAVSLSLRIGGVMRGVVLRVLSVPVL